MPSALVTVTATAPADSAGAVTTIWLAVSLTMVAAVLPKLTEVALARSAPLIVTVVPAVKGPVAGVTLVTTGVNWNLSAEDVAEVPPAVMTVTSTLPVPAGALTTIWLEVSLVKVVTGVVPKSTTAGPLRLVPVMVTVVPPLPPLAGRNAGHGRGRGSGVGEKIRRGRGRGAVGVGHGHVDGSRRFGRSCHDDLAGRVAN